MRERFAEGLTRADVVVVWLPDAETQAVPELLALLKDKPVFTARLTAQRPALMEHVLGFAGIAKPWKFEATLRDLGYEVVEFRGFPDHVSPSDAELAEMQEAAQNQLSDLITTEKDWVRLDKVWRDRVKCLPIRAHFDDEPGFVAALDAALAKT
jgi:tetraacyldisaccharide 4'-kinase